VSGAREARDIAELCRSQDRWRASTINLIASENVLSPAARAVMDTDFHHRYAEGHPGDRYYEGTRYIDAVEERARTLVQEIFGADRADVRLPSATMANEAVFSALLPEGGTAFAHGIGGGGHISHAKFGALGKRATKIVEYPRSADGWHIDVPAAIGMIRAERPRLIVLGRSLFLFPDPVAALRPVCDEVGAVIVYDGSHVLGLIAGGEFQDPLGAGADVMTASTHKTYYGPQRGIVVARGKSDEFWKPIDRAVFPGVTSNHHLFTLPPLVVASLEVRDFGRQYAKDVVANAQALGRSLHERGLTVAAADQGYTRSHQVAVDVGDLGGGREVARRLCDNGVVCNMNLLPGEPRKNARNPRGLRLGVQEMTRFGMGPREMDRIADLFRECLVRGRSIAEDCRALRAEFPAVRYGYAASDVTH